MSRTSLRIEDTMIVSDTGIMLKPRRLRQNMQGSVFHGRARDFPSWNIGITRSPGPTRAHPDLSQMSVWNAFQLGRKEDSDCMML